MDDGDGHPAAAPCRLRRRGRIRARSTARSGDVPSPVFATLKMAVAIVFFYVIAPFSASSSLWVSAEPSGARAAVSGLRSASPHAPPARSQAPHLRRRILDLSISEEGTNQVEPVGNYRLGGAPSPRRRRKRRRRELKEAREKKPSVETEESAGGPASINKNAKRPPHAVEGAKVVAGSSNSGDSDNKRGGGSEDDPRPIKRGSGLLDLSSYIDPDTILYDVVQGFLLASLLCGFLVLSYRLCLGCLVRCGICPDDRILRAYHRRHRHQSRVGGFGGPNVYEMVGQEDEGSAWDDESSAVDSELSMEYGHAFDDDDEDSDEPEDDGVRRFSEIQISRAAEGYFDREEEQERMLKEVVERQRREEEEDEEEEEDIQQEKKESNNNCSRSDDEKASSNDKTQPQLPNSQKRRKKKKKHRRGGSRGGVSCASSIFDDEDEDDLPPLDLEMIERKAAEEVGEDGADLIQPSPRASPLVREEEEEAIVDEEDAVVTEVSEVGDNVAGEGEEGGTTTADEVDSDESFGPTEEEMNF